MSSIPQLIIDNLKAISSPERAAHSQRFFKTGKGEYGEGDQFLGISNPKIHEVVKFWWQKTNFKELEEIITSPLHEVRMTALLILVKKYERSKIENEKQNIAHFYLANLQYVNNWDLVDLSSYKIAGSYAYHFNQDDILVKLSESKNMWEMRIAVVGSLYYIKNNKMNLPLEIITKNLTHPHDLMHKANGWMLREIGKKDLVILEDYLKKYYLNIPRTTLRYAIEKMVEPKRIQFLKGEF